MCLLLHPIAKDRLGLLFSEEFIVEQESLLKVVFPPNPESKSEFFGNDGRDFLDRVEVENLSRGYCYDFDSHK